MSSDYLFMEDPLLDEDETTHAHSNSADRTVLVKKKADSTFYFAQRQNKNATGNAYVSSVLTSESVGRETSAYVYATDF